MFCFVERHIALMMSLVLSYMYINANHHSYKRFRYLILGATVYFIPLLRRPFYDKRMSAEMECEFLGDEWKVMAIKEC